MNLNRQVVEINDGLGGQVGKLSKKKITLKFVSVDTDELQGTEINYSGNGGFYKIGEGDLNHY
jgi:hypothetical protein